MSVRVPAHRLRLSSIAVAATGLVIAAALSQFHPLLGLVGVALLLGWSQLPGL